MNFLISEEQHELVDAVRGYLAGTHGPEVLRKLDTRGNRDATIWQGLAEMGLPGLLVPEEFGGLGLGLLDAALVARECGRAALAEPLVETAFVAVPWMLARGETDALGDIASGVRKISVPHLTNGWELDGNGDALASVDPMRNLTVLPADSSEDPLALDLGALMTAAELVGLAEAMLDQAVEYARVREQFGQPIGGFQAIKHKLADVAVALEFSRPVLWRAAQAMVDTDPGAPVHVSHAKIAATDAAYLAAESAIQTHGAMGYTYEVDLHFWMKRTWALGGAWGSRGFHYARLDGAVIGGAMSIGPEHTFSSAPLDGTL